MKSSLKEDAPQQGAATNALHLNLIIFAYKAPIKIKRRLELSVSVDGSMAQHPTPKWTRMVMTSIVIATIGS
jgi:hypothetical protein